MSVERSENVGKRATRRPKNTRERVRTFLKLFGNSETVLILIYPDPDSMASALAVKGLLWKRVRSTSIAYIGKIQRLENQAMMDLLKIPMVELSKLDPANFSRRILVDAQPDHSEIFEGYAYDAIIDRHPKTKKWGAPYLDIRPEYGATAQSLLNIFEAHVLNPL
jgi:nanoRNase/pAp phosphatase (c-di-AMP/oligoRNAs hydrolase)